MGNNLRIVASQCTQCLQMKRQGPPQEEKHNQIHQLVNLTKNPSSDVSQQIDHNKLSFALDNQADQTYDMTKSPEDVDTSMTLSSGKMNTSPNKSTSQILKGISGKKENEAHGGILSPQPTQLFQQQQTITEESPMLQDETQSLESERSNTSTKEDPDEFQVSFINSQNDQDKIYNLLQQSLQDFKQQIKVQGEFEPFYNSEGLTIQSKSRQQKSDKVYITTMKYQFKLDNFTLEKYIKLTSDPNLLKQMETPMEQYDILSEFQQDKSIIRLINMKYKKVQIIDPKEYLYIKLSTQEGNTITEVCNSVNIPDIQSPQYNSGIKSPKRVQKGIIHLAGLKATEQDNSLLIEGLCEVNLKIKLPPTLTKKIFITEATAMVERLKKFTMNFDP